MDCIFYLRDTLATNCYGQSCSTPPPGGTWYLSESGFGYPISINVNGVNVVIPDANTPITKGDDNPYIDMSKMPLADYTFKYVYGNCDNVAYVYFTGVNAPCQANNLSFTVCAGDGTLSLYDSMVAAYTQGNEECIPTAYGNFEVLDPVGDFLGSADFVGNITLDNDATNDTWDTETSPAGDYQIKYTYGPQYNSDCDVCQKEVILTITLANPADAGNGTGIVVCT